MYRRAQKIFALILPLTLLPQAAFAADFGFVRWPGYLDMPIVLSAVLTAVAVVVFKTQMPKTAKDFVSVPKEERSFLLNASAIVMLGGLVLCIGMMLVGMGLQRVVE